MSANALSDRGLIFRNLLNGVPPETVAKAFKVSREEIDRTVAFALGKVKSYMHERAMPPLALDDIAHARRHRRIVLLVLERLNMATPPRFKRFGECPIEDQIKELTSA